MVITPLVRRNASSVSASISIEYYCGGVARGKVVGVIAAALHAYPYYMKLYIWMYLYVFLYCCCCCSCDFFNASLQIEKSPDKIPLRVCQYIQIYECNCARCVYKSYNRKVKRIGILHVVVVRIGTFFNVPTNVISFNFSPFAFIRYIENSVMNVRWFCARASRGSTFVYMYIFILYTYYNTFISMRNSHCVFVYTRMIGSHL